MNASIRRLSGRGLTTGSIVVLLCLLLFSCSKSEPPAPSQDTIARPKPSGTASAVDKRARVNSLQISDFKFVPETPTATADLSVVPFLKDPQQEGVTFQFKWFVNRIEIDGATGVDLPRTYFKKNDWIFCRVKAVKEDQESAWQNSPVIRVLNSPPQVEAAVEAFEAPGTFSYQIVASDPDGDEMLFHLLEPLTMGISLDVQSGLLQWPIDLALIEKVGPTVTIRFEVIDNGGLKNSGSIQLTFTGKS